MTTLSTSTASSPAASSAGAGRWFKSLVGRFSAAELAQSGKQLLLPIIGILLFLGFWHLAAPQVNTSLGAFPGPVQVWEQGGQLWQEHSAQRDRADKFITMQEERNARILAKNPDAEVKIRSYRARLPSWTRSSPA